MTTTLARLAIIPGLIIIIYIYSKDKVEKEPIGLIIRLLIYGMLCCFVAGYAEQIVSAMLPQFPLGSPLQAMTTAFCVAGFCEELVKYLALRLGSWNNPSFNYRFDGIVYGVSVAVGFAILENVMYVAMYGFGTAVARAFTAVPLHAFCGAVMGILYSYAKKSSIDGDRTSATIYGFAAWLLPLIIHGVYDTFAMMRTQTASIMLIVFIILLYIFVVKMINKMSRDDYRGGFYR